MLREFDRHQLRPQAQEFNALGDEASSEREALLGRSRLTDVAVDDRRRFRLARSTSVEVAFT